MEGRDLGKGIGLQEISRRVGKINIDNVDVETVGLSDRLDGSGAGLVLEEAEVSTMSLGRVLRVDSDGAETMGNMASLQEQ